MIAITEYHTVHASPELMAKLMARRDDGTQELTHYAVEHGVELPEGHTPEWDIVVMFDDEGNERGLYWLAPHEYTYEDMK